MSVISQPVNPLTQALSSSTVIVTRIQGPSSLHEQNRKICLAVGDEHGTFDTITQSSKSGGASVISQILDMTLRRDGLEDVLCDLRLSADSYQFGL